MTLTKHYKLFNALLYSKNFSGTKVKLYRSKIRILCGYLYGNSYESEPENVKIALINKSKRYACDELFFNYIDKKHYKKYNPEFSLSTWIEQYISLNINNILRKHKPRSEVEGINSRSDLCAPDNSNFKKSYEESEDWLDLSTNLENPEFLFQKKELLTLAVDHFGVVDLRVILGIVSKQSIIRTHNLNYDRYTKLLYRKRLLFRPVLVRNGYDLN